MAASAAMLPTLAAPPRRLLSAARWARCTPVSAANPSPQFLGRIAHSRPSANPRVYASSTGKPAVESSPSVHSVKEFLEDLKSVGRLRIIVNTGVGVLESVTTFDKLFYSELPGKGQYANLMSKEDNVDFHLLIDKVASAKLVQGKRSDVPTYMVRFFDSLGANAASLLLMWRPETNGEYDEGQVEAFNELLSRYGAEVSFATPS